MSINYRTDASYVGVKRSFKLSVKLRNYGMTSVTVRSRAKLQLRCIVYSLENNEV